MQVSYDFKNSTEHALSEENCLKFVLLLSSFIVDGFFACVRFTRCAGISNKMLRIKFVKKKIGNTFL